MRTRMIRAFGAAIAVVLLTALGLAGTGTANAASATASAASQGRQDLGTTYGAFAYGPPDYSTVVVAGGSTVTSAEQAAVQKCGGSDKNCIPVAWFGQAYGTFDISGNDAFGWAARATSQAADQAALQECQQRGGTQCHPVIREATANPSTAFTGSDLIGRVCMVDAPKATTFGIEHGHVAWAFLISRDTGQWEYGANDGPVNIPSDWTSKTWYKTGDEKAMVAAFRAFKNADGSQYYQFIDCLSLSTNDSSAADQKVVSEQQEQYNVLTTTCLTDAANVMTAYGVSGLPLIVEGIIAWPNIYFNRLPGLGFEQWGLA
jgi:hypothetical protein